MGRFKKFHGHPVRRIFPAGLEEQLHFYRSCGTGIDGARTACRCAVKQICVYERTAAHLIFLALCEQFGGNVSRVECHVQFYEWTHQLGASFDWFIQSTGMAVQSELGADLDHDFDDMDQCRLYDGFISSRAAGRTQGSV
ncbi:hypothetical protein D3C73_1077180 [compost metagenome]